MYRAKVSEVNFGSNLSIEGLLLEDGSNAIAVSQFGHHFLIGPNHHTKQVKALLGIDLPLAQVATEIHAKKLNIISLKQFEIAVAKLDRQGNLKAQAFRDALVGLSLQELFNDAFGKASDAKSRQAYLNSIANIANPWERLVEKSTCDKIREFYSNQCSQSFWWKWVYCFLTPEERCKLDALNPIVGSRGKRNRKTKIHQWIAIEEGIRDRLQAKMGELVLLLNTSTGKQDFETRANRLAGYNQVEIF